MTHKFLGLETGEHKLECNKMVWHPTLWGQIISWTLTFICLALVVSFLAAIFFIDKVRFNF